MLYRNIIDVARTLDWLEPAARSPRVATERNELQNGSRLLFNI